MSTQDQLQKQTYPSTIPSPNISIPPNSAHASQLRNPNTHGIRISLPNRTRIRYRFEQTSTRTIPLECHHQPTQNYSSSPLVSMPDRMNPIDHASAPIIIWPHWP
ncbi:hypothetical protein DSO57_1012116 [Entomophthora muscae]|uniref:Uncharacterized protein n=1 Tax=Entomophthora muscae TaxID=34485 RepID=A0ACC2SJ33_9FUNG|nr:hypothetical protein DSO57_1012116 [Entomophthora muscae]